jgi:hypothetical protein
MDKEEKKRHFEFLRRKYKIIYNFFNRDKLGSEFHLMDMDIVERCNSVRDFQYLEADANEEIRLNMSPGERRELSAILQRELGIDLAAELARDLERLHKVVARGKVKSPAEYELLAEYASDVANGLDPEMIAAIDKLLHAYRPPGQKA